MCNLVSIPGDLNLPDYIFQTYLPLFPEGYKGTMIDIGAHDPILMNNSWSFEQIGWECWCVEPNPLMVQELVKVRKNVVPYAISGKNSDDTSFYICHAPGHNMAGGSGLTLREDMNAYERKCDEVKVGTRTFDWLINQHIKKKDIDIVTIDVEWHEMEVLSTFEQADCNIKIIVIENIGDHPSQNIWFSQHGWTKRERVGLDNIYIKEELFRV